MNAITIIAALLGGWIVLWVLFLAVMKLRDARDAGTLRARTPAYCLGLFVLAIGYAVDALVNLTGATLLFLELPRELTVTARCKRLSPLPTWRGAVARWLCDTLLHPFDPGHCY